MSYIVAANDQKSSIMTVVNVFVLRAVHASAPAAAGAQDKAISNLLTSLDN